MDVISTHSSDGMFFINGGVAYVRGWRLTFARGLLVALLSGEAAELGLRIASKPRQYYVYYIHIFIKLFQVKIKLFCKNLNTVEPRLTDTSFTLAIDPCKMLMHFT